MRPSIKLRDMLRSPFLINALAQFAENAKIAAFSIRNRLLKTSFFVTALIYLRLLGLFVLAAFVTFASLTTPAVLAADDGASLLDKFLQKTPHAEIVFRQTSLDDNGRELSISEGRFWYKRPDFFRMEYSPPTALLMVSDGKTTWTYEEDLNQVLQNPSQATGDSALLAVLSSGSLAALDGKYILSSGIAGAWRWAVAEARDQQQTIRLLRLGFSAASGELQQVELTDAFGGVARLDVVSINRETIDDNLFNFTPPPGVDVVGGE